MPMELEQRQVDQAEPHLSHGQVRTVKPEIPEMLGRPEHQDLQVMQEHQEHLGATLF